MGGQVFGQLQRIVGITYIRLSPYELKATSGLFTKGPRNFIRKCRDTFFTIIMPITLTYVTKEWADAEYEKQIRKKPGDFANDE